MPTGGLAAAAAVALAGCSPADNQKETTAAPQPRPDTPRAAFARLMEGNAHGVSGDLDHPDRDPERRELVAGIRDPYGVVLTCIDSRVAPERVFGTGLGDLYVPRTGGRAIGPVVTGSVECGPMTGGTPLIAVLGHQRCGAVEAAYTSLNDGAPLPGNLRV
ncbi:carbonic anhydrase [Streptomyces sp. NPDC059496]|uniref:carbonic anhydrase n=1 Tax=Streptomyces sp. NPDC059496 TaxID=3346851 RepID=UPI0036CD4DF2